MLVVDSASVLLAQKIAHAQFITSVATVQHSLFCANNRVCNSCGVND